MKYSVTDKKKWWFGASALLILASIAALIFWTPRAGVDFTGGSLLEIKAEDADVTKVRNFMEKEGYEGAEVQATGEEGIAIRLKRLNSEGHEKLLSALKEKFLGIEERRFNTVGPTFSSELLGKAILAVVLAALGILIYLAIVFRKASAVVSSWLFGIIAVLVLLHDIVITAGFFAVYAHFRNATADSLFVTALLTTIGFSVHDTIVIFNRIKANLRQFRASLSEIVDRSVLETFTRSINTSVTTLLVLLALLFFGGVTIRPFIITLVAGIIAGTYSSIFVAAPLLAWWQERNR